MNIVKVVVDTLPESTYRCFAAEGHWNYLEKIEVVECKILQRKAYMSFDDFFMRLCPDCPLEEVCSDE